MGDTHLVNFHSEAPFDGSCFRLLPASLPPPLGSWGAQAYRYSHRKLGRVVRLPAGGQGGREEEGCRGAPIARKGDMGDSQWRYLSGTA